MENRDAGSCFGRRAHKPSTRSSFICAHGRQLPYAPYKPPRVIADLCQRDDDSKQYECQSAPISIEAYVDLTNLPNIILVSSPDHYGNGNDMISLFCGSCDARVPKDAYHPDINTRIFGPAIKAVVTDAVIVKEMTPGNGVAIPLWHLEISSPDQVQYYKVDANGDVEPIE